MHKTEISTRGTEQLARLVEVEDEVQLAHVAKVAVQHLHKVVDDLCSGHHVTQLQVSRPGLPKFHFISKETCEVALLLFQTNTCLIISGVGDVQKGTRCATKVTTGPHLQRD